MVIGTSRVIGVSEWRSLESDNVVRDRVAVCRPKLGDTGSAGVRTGRKLVAWDECRAFTVVILFIELCARSKIR